MKQMVLPSKVEVGTWPWTRLAMRSATVPAS
jgi:hypothetical protein